MSNYVEFTADNGTVLVEALAPSRSTTTRGERQVEELVRASESLEQVLGRVGPAVRGLVSHLRSTTEQPSHVEIEFGVKLSADARVIIASAKGEANFRVLLKWAEPNTPA